MGDYNPAHDLTLNARDELAMRAPLPSFVFQPNIVMMLCGLKSVEEIRTVRDLPLAIARWQYACADAQIMVRKEISDATLSKEFK